MRAKHNPKQMFVLIGKHAADTKININLLVQRRSSKISDNLCGTASVFHKKKYY